MQVSQVFVRLLGFSLAFLLSIHTGHGATTVTGAQNIVVSVDAAGPYDIYVPNTGWHFGGSLNHALSNIAVAGGNDASGHYSEISFDFQADIPRHAAIRAYWEQPAVLFTANWPAGGTNNSLFPSLSNYPANLNHIAFSGVFADPTFTALPGESPWAFFDAHGNSFLISPASNFMVASLNQPKAGTISSGIDGRIATLPQGFSHQTLLVIETGINRAFHTWGHMLTNLQGKTRPGNDADRSLDRLGYWTDNGGNYYYHRQGDLSYEETLTAVKADFDRQGIGLGYVQLDSWFYPKGPDAEWFNGAYGFSEYQASTVLFGAGLGGFQRQLGTPLITHARWIDESSPYRKQYKISGNVSTDPAYWNYVAGYLAGSGVATYEQDWLVGPAVPDFNLTDPEAFMGNMASAMAQRNITMQYCMPTPRHVMQSSKYSNLTTIRGAADRFTPERWTAFLYASRLIGAVGAWPFTDVFMSGETSNMLLTVLSAGPVGVGDPIGGLNTANLLKAVRADGVIVKPDVPATPLDRSFLGSAGSSDTPMIASAHTSFGDLTAHYVFAYPQGLNHDVSFTLPDLGMRGQAYVYDYFSGEGQLVKPGPHAGVTGTITGDSLYLVVAPVGPSGIAMIGDTGHFVTLGKKRVTALTDDGAVHLTLAFAAGETSRRIEGYSPVAVQVRTANGVLGEMSYQGATGRFSIVAGPGADGSATIQIDPSGAPQGRDR